MYLQPPSPQSCTTPQPETSQLDTSKLTEKSQWRNYTDPKGFCEFAGWDQPSQDKFESLFRSDREGEKFQDWLVDTAEIESSVLQTRLGKSGLNAKVNWTSVLPSSDTTLNNLMVTWIDLRKVTYILSRDRGQDKALADQLATMLPKIKQAKREAQYRDAARAFYVGERLTADNKRPSDTVLEKLVDCYNSYKPEV